MRFLTIVGMVQREHKGEFSHELVGEELMMFICCGSCICQENKHIFFLET